MTDVTTTANPALTPDTNLPQRDSTGTLLNPASPSITTDSSTTTPQSDPANQSQPTTPDGTKTPDGNTLLNKTNTPTGAPDTYTDFKLPDGLTLEPTALTEATAVFKDLNLTQAQAQSLVDFHAKQLKAVSDGPLTAVTTMKADWETQVRDTYGKDIEPGGKVAVTISRAIDSLPPALAKDFRAAMDLTLAGSNPAFVAAFYEFSKRLGEGTTVKGNGPSPGGQASPDAKPKTVAQAMYPHLPSAS